MKDIKVSKTVAEFLKQDELAVNLPENKFFDFCQYFISCYGKGQIHEDHCPNPTLEEIMLAVNTRLERYPDSFFDGDTLDRERVRDIILEMRGL